MKRTRVFQLVGSLVTLAIIFIGCNDFGRVAEKTKEVAKDFIENGRQAGIFRDTGGNGQATGPAAAVQTASATGGANGNSLPVYVQVPRDQAHIALGTFNIQVFGVSKLRNADVTTQLVNIVRQFDCLAIQELRSKDDSVIPRFLQLVNANGGQYQGIVSQRLGNRSTEQYVYLFDTTRIELVSQGFVTADPHDRLHREPYVALFRTRTADPRQAFTFALVNIHIDPDVTQSELAALADTYLWLRQILPGEDDVIILGDFNEPPQKYGRLGQIPNLIPVLSGDIPTNTRKTAAYDNILIDQQLTREFTGYAGALDLEQMFGLNYEQARQISDHLPVWAVFSAGEAASVQFATQPPVPAWQNSSR